MGIQLHYLGDAVKYNGGGLYYFPVGPEIDGEVVFGVLSISGETGISGVVSMPILSISGEITSDFIFGEIPLHCVRVDGDISISAAINGEVGIPLPSVYGLMQADGEILIPALRISGDMQSEGVMDADITIQLLRVSGSMRGSVFLSGAITLPVVGVSGVMTRFGSGIDGEVSLHVLRVSGSVYAVSSHDFGSEADVTLRFNKSRRLI